MLALALVAVAGVWMAARTTAPAPAPSPVTAPEGVAGFAEMYVATFLTAAGDERPDALDAFVVTVDGLDALTPYQRYVPRSSAIRVEPLGADYWSVLVAAEVLYRIDDGYGPGAVEYYDVAVAVTGDGYVATAAPLPVPEPAAPVPYGTYAELRSSADEATVGFLTDFLGAYFGGSGRLPRLVTPDSGIAALDPVAEIEVRSVTTGLVGDATWASATAVLTSADGVSLPTSVTVRLVGDGSNVRVAELVAGPPPMASPGD